MPEAVFYVDQQEIFFEEFRLSSRRRTDERGRPNAPFEPLSLEGILPAGSLDPYFFQWQVSGEKRSGKLEVKDDEGADILLHLQPDSIHLKEFKLAWEAEDRQAQQIVVFELPIPDMTCYENFPLQVPEPQGLILEIEEIRLPILQFEFGTYHGSIGKEREHLLHFMPLSLQFRASNGYLKNWLLTDNVHPRNARIHFPDQSIMELEEAYMVYYADQYPFDEDFKWEQIELSVGKIRWGGVEGFMPWSR